jgi:stringent starvation protein B
MDGLSSPLGKSSPLDGVVGGTTPGGCSSVTGGDASLCGICFCEVDPVDNPRGTLNSCDHLFCLYCISTWAKDTNVCPHCKARFTRITSAPVASSGNNEPIVIKVRRKNYRGWEEAYDDDEDDEGAVAAAVQASVACRLCNSTANAARMLFCDRRTCHFVAHLDCLELREAPLTYVCAECSGLGGADRNLQADAATAERLQREIEAEDRTGLRRTGIPSVAVARASTHAPAAVAANSAPDRSVDRRPSVSIPVRNVQPVVPVPQVVVPLHDVDDGVPYYLKGPHRAHAELAQQQLQSRFDAAAYEKQVKLQQKSAVRARNSSQGLGEQHVTHPADAVTATEERAEQQHTALQSQQQQQQQQPAEESAEQIERRLTKLYFRDQLAVARRRDYVQRNQLRLIGEGHIAVRPVNRVEELCREDALRVEALQAAQRMAKERMEGIHRALKLREERALKYKAAREAHALAKLAEIIAQHRLKELQALRDRFKALPQSGAQVACPAQLAESKPPLVEKSENNDRKVKQEPKW